MRAFYPCYVMDAALMQFRQLIDLLPLCLR